MRVINSQLVFTFSHLEREYREISRHFLIFLQKPDVIFFGVFTEEDYWKRVSISCVDIISSHKYDQNRGSIELSWLKMPWGKNKENVSPEEINVKIYLWRKLTEIGNYDRFINHSGQQNLFRYNFNENISITEKWKKMFFSLGLVPSYCKLRLLKACALRNISFLENFWSIFVYWKLKLDSRSLFLVPLLPLPP